MIAGVQVWQTSSRNQCSVFQGNRPGILTLCVIISGKLRYSIASASSSGTAEPAASVFIPSFIYFSLKISSTCAPEVRWMGACGADSAARGRWQPFERSKVSRCACFCRTTRVRCDYYTKQHASVPHRAAYAVWWDGGWVGGGGVFQPGRLHLMRVMQQAPWWVFPQNSCRHNFSHLINELGTLQQIQWHGPAPPPAPSPPAAPSAVQCVRGLFWFPRVPSLIWHTFQTRPATRCKVGGRRASPRSQGRGKKTKKKQTTKWEAPAWVAADVRRALPRQQLAAAKLRWRHVRLLFIIVFALLCRDAGMSKSWRKKSQLLFFSHLIFILQSPVLW